MIIIPKYTNRPDLQGSHIQSNCCSITLTGSNIAGTIDLTTKKIILNTNVDNEQTITGN